MSLRREISSFLPIVLLGTLPILYKLRYLAIRMCKVPSCRKVLGIETCSLVHLHTYYRKGCMYLLVMTRAGELAELAGSMQ